MTIETLDDLFFHTMKAVVHTARKILKMLPKMERKAADKALSKMAEGRLNAAAAA